jgi:hypothetical protein
LEDHEDHGSPSESKKDITSTASTPAHSRPSSPVRSPDQTILSSEPTKREKIDESTAKKRAASTIEEYWSVKLKEEVVLSIKELGAEWGTLVVFTFLEKTMETKLQKVEDMAQILVELVTTSSVSKSDVKAGVSQYAEFLEDISIDCPDLYKFFGTLLSILIHGSIVSFSDDTLEILSFVIDSKAMVSPVNKILNELIAGYIRIFGKDDLEVFSVEYKAFFKGDEKKEMGWWSKCPFTVELRPDFWVASEVSGRFKRDTAESIVSWIQV